MSEPNTEVAPPAGAVMIVTVPSLTSFGFGSRHTSGPLPGAGDNEAGNPAGRGGAGITGAAFGLAGAGATGTMMERVGAGRWGGGACAEAAPASRRLTITAGSSFQTSWGTIGDAHRPSPSRCRRSDLDRSAAFTSTPPCASGKRWASAAPDGTTQHSPSRCESPRALMASSGLDRVGSCWLGFDGFAARAGILYDGVHMPRRSGSDCCRRATLSLQVWAQAASECCRRARISSVTTMARLSAFQPSPLAKAAA